MKTYQNSPRSRRQRRGESPVFLLLVLTMMLFCSPFVYASMTKEGGQKKASLAEPSSSEVLSEETKAGKELAPAGGEGIPSEAAAGGSAPADNRTMDDSSKTVTSEADKDGETQKKEAADASKPSETDAAVPESGASRNQAESEKGRKEFVTVEESYFDDALFIGDSRTVGIKEYSHLKNASYFCENSMTVFSAMERSLSVKGGRERTLSELLEEERYGKIYVMLGINELGYPFHDVERQFGRLIALIREKQPDAILFIGANLHVTEKRSKSDSIYNNGKIDELNHLMREFSLGDDRIYYIDVNEIFDDESGGLRADYSSDSAHVYGKYYRTWAEWLCTKGIL